MNELLYLGRVHLHKTNLQSTNNILKLSFSSFALLEQIFKPGQMINWRNACNWYFSLLWCRLRRKVWFCIYKPNFDLNLLVKWYMYLQYTTDFTLFVCNLHFFLQLAIFISLLSSTILHKELCLVSISTISIFTVTPISALIKKCKENRYIFISWLKRLNVHKIYICLYNWTFKG